MKQDPIPSTTQPAPSTPTAGAPANTPLAGRAARREIIAAIAGNPNSGKTSIFNNLTGLAHSVANYPDSETYPGLLVMRFDAGLFFASADALEDRLRELAQEAETRYDTVVISFEGVDFIDSQGSEKLSEILGLAETYGAEVRLARVKPAVIALLRRDGVIDELGEDNVYGNVYEACADRIPGA